MREATKAEITMKKAYLGAGLLAGMLSVQSGQGQDALVAYKVLSPDTALELAQASLQACRDKGFQVAVAVVDRFGQPQVMLRDRFAGPHTPSTATNKAWTAVSFRTNTSDLIALTQPGQPQAGLRGLPNVVILGGGVLIEGAGATLGAVGVSGAPGGPEDDDCARAGIDAVRDKLEL